MCVCTCACLCVRVHGCAYVHMRMRVCKRGGEHLEAEGERCCRTKGRQAGKGGALVPDPGEPCPSENPQPRGSSSTSPGRWRPSRRTKKAHSGEGLVVLIVGGGGASSKKEMGLISGLSVPAQSLVQAGKMTRAFLWGQARVPDWCRKTVHHSSGGSIVSCSCLIQTGATTLAVCLCRPAGFPWGLFGQRAHPRSLGDWVGR